MAKSGVDRGESKGKPPQYPYYSFQKAKEVGEAVRDCGGVRGEVQKSVLAHRMRADENSSAFTNVTGAAKCFGIIQGWGSYSLTDAAKLFFYPSDPHQQRRSLLEMIKSPPAFGVLIDRFDGTRLPEVGLIANILHREFGVPESWMSRVASLFISSMREADLIDSGGFLRYSATMHSNAGMDVAHDMSEDRPATDEVRAVPEISQRPAPPSIQPSIQATNGDLNAWVFSGKNGGTLRVETPRELTMDLWNKLSKYVQMLKPDSDGGEA